MRIRPLAVVVVLALAAAACGNAKSGSSPNSGGAAGGGDTGVSATEIRVGGLAAKTGPLAGQYEPISKGVQAYLDMVNEQGGVNGRKITYIGERDDATNPSRDTAQARALVEQDKVFAIVGIATPLFPAGTYLATTGVPTFGWNVDAEWSSGPNLFGEKGSFLDFTRASPFLPYLAKQAGATKAAIIAYTAAQSAECATGQENSYKKFGIAVGLNDSSLPFGATNVDVDIQRIKQAGVDFVSTCMDPTGNTLVAKALRDAGLTNVKMYWPNGYDQETLSKFGDLMEGVYFGAFFVPFQAADRSPGMTQFLDQMKKRFPDQQISEVVLAGWINADLFVSALKAVGKNPTRKAVIDWVNGQTHYTANGILPGIDWTTQHKTIGPDDCTAALQVQHGKFVPVFGSPASVFTCFPITASTLDTIPAPRG